MKIELTLTDEQVRLMQNVLYSRSTEIHLQGIDYAIAYRKARDNQLKSANFDDMENAYKQCLMLEMVADMIHEQYEANKQKP